MAEQSGGIWTELPAELEAHIVSFLPQNEIAGSIRLVNKAAAAQFSSPQHKTLRLSQPVPPVIFAAHWRPDSPTWRKLGIKQRRKLLDLVSASGIPENVQLAVQAAGCILDSKPLEAAAEAGHVHICALLRQQGCPWGTALDAAAKGGHQHACEWLLANGYPLHTDPSTPYNRITTAARVAAVAGHPGLVDWLLGQFPDPRVGLIAWVVVDVAQGCDLATLQRFYLQYMANRNGREEDQQQQQQQQAEEEEEGQGDPAAITQQPQQPTASPVAAAPAAAPAAAGSFDQDLQAPLLRAAACSPTPDWREKFRWLEEQGCVYPPDLDPLPAADPVAADLPAWIRQRDSAWRPTSPACVAASKGDLPALAAILEAATEADRQAGKYTAHVAAHEGHLGALQLLHARGWLTDPRAVLGEAASGGHLHIVEWMVQALGMGLEVWQEVYLGHSAAAAGSVALLSWLRDRGLEWDAEVLSAAADSGVAEAVEFVGELAGEAFSAPAYGHPYTRAATNGDLATLELLRRLGCVWDDDPVIFSNAMKDSAPIPALRWLLEAGCSVDWDEALDLVGLRDDDDEAEVTAWLEEQRRMRGEEEQGEEEQGEEEGAGAGGGERQEGAGAGGSEGQAGEESQEGE